MTTPNTWPTTAEIPSDEHTGAASDRIDLARPEIHKGIQAQRKMATILNASDMEDGEILAYNAANSRFEPSRTSDIQRYVNHPLPTASQLRIVPGVPYNVQTDITPDFRAGSFQRYRFRSGPQTSATSITASVVSTNGQWVNVNLPTNFQPGNILTLLIQNVNTSTNNPGGTNPVRVSWNDAYHFQSSPGFSFASGKIHDIPYNTTWQFKLVKITDTTILVSRVADYAGLAL